MRHAIFGIVFAAVTTAQAAAPLEMKNVVLLQPDIVMRECVHNLPAFASYIRSIEAAATKATVSPYPGSPTGGFLVVALRPGNRSRAWLDFKPELPPRLAKAMLAHMTAVPSPMVTCGPVVFALRVSLWGGSTPTTNLPFPAEWSAAVEEARRPLETGELVEKIWRD